MPSKASSSKSIQPQGPSKDTREAVNRYLAQKPDFEKLIKEAKESPNSVRSGRAETEYERKAKEAIKEILLERREEAKARSQTVDMPVHPKEEEAGDNLTDKVAQESKDSNASDHPLHTKDAATFEHHRANPGPVMAENLGEPASKEELKKRAEELNKK